MANENKISESIEFLTQIHTAWDGTEQRVGLRTQPRRLVEYDYLGTDSRESQYLKALTRVQQTQIFLMPLWHAASQNIKPAYKGASQIFIQKSVIWQYRDCVGVLMWGDDTYGGDYYKIVNLNADGSIVLNKTLPYDWVKGAIVPVAYGIMGESADFMFGSSQQGSTTVQVHITKATQSPMFPVTFDSSHDEAIEVERGGRLYGTTYNSHELFLMRPTWDEDMTTQSARNANLLDNSTGVFKYDLKSIEATESVTFPMLGRSREECNNIQRFFYRCMGKLHSFYAPTWTSDIKLHESVAPGSTEWVVELQWYYKYYNKGTRRKTAIIFFRDGTAEIVTISAYTTDDSGEYGRILVDQPAKRQLNNDSVEMISFLVCWRLDNDTLKFDYSTVECASCELNLVEVEE